MSIRAIIVDDVDLARSRIRHFTADQEVEIIAECQNGREAIEAIQALKPDLVFLDIQMPVVSGLEVIETIGVEQMPVIVFVSAFDDFALQAFDSNAVDYLLKPFSKQRFLKALSRAKAEIRAKFPLREIESKIKQILIEVKTKPQYLKRLPIKNSRGTNLVLIEEIDWIGSAGHYLEIHVGAAVHIIRESLSNFETKLNPNDFRRIHRSTIINVHRIESIHPRFNGDQTVTLKNGKSLNVSATYYDKIKEWLEL